MDSTYFEGYTGIYLNNMTFSNDILLLAVFILLFIFACVFRFNRPLFGKMIADANANEQRQSIFDTTQKDRFLLNLFMNFQALLLCSIFFFLVCAEYGFFINPDMPETLLTTALLFVVLLVFYFFKRCIYAVFGHVFLESDARKTMFMNCQALFCVWGISLYIPVLWILLIGEYFFVPYSLFIISYLIYRAILIYRFIYIFSYRNTGLLFLSLYLCGQEIIPMVFLYEGLIYMYNIIETNNIWQ
jgi:hypothetical protein